MTAAGPLVTVAIVTNRRPHMLVNALTSIVDGTDGVPFEVLVVENDLGGSAQGALSALPPWVCARIVQADRRASDARNVALREAHGEVVAFLDDDAVADPGWLRALVGAYTNPHVAAAGGPIRPEFAASPPRWIQNAYASGSTALVAEWGLLDWGGEARELALSQDLYGPNMSVRREIAIRCGGFRTDLGPKAQQWFPGEDVDLIRKLHLAGYTVMWVPSAAVRHVIDEHKMTRRFLWRRAFARGLVVGRHMQPHSLDPSVSTSAAAPAVATGGAGLSHLARRLMLGIQTAGRVAYHLALAQILWLAGNRTRGLDHDRAWAQWLGVLTGRLTSARRSPQRGAP